MAHCTALPSHHTCNTPFCARAQVVLVGGRVLLGDLQCLDKQGNLILGNTVEQLSHIQDSQGNERTMGTVLVPKEHQQQVHVMVRE